MVCKNNLYQSSILVAEDWKRPLPDAIIDVLYRQAHVGVNRERAQVQLL